MFEDPGQLRQIVRDRQQMLMAEVANDRLAQAVSTHPTRAARIGRALVTAVTYGLVALGAAIAIFLIATFSVQLWLATATPTPPGGYAYPVPLASVTPDPHPQGPGDGLRPPEVGQSA